MVAPKHVGLVAHDAERHCGANRSTHRPVRGAGSRHSPAAFRLGQFWSSMSVLHTLAYALTQGLASALPVSESGHGLVLRIWLGAPGQPPAHAAMASIGAMAAIAVVVRGRLMGAFSDGVRGGWRDPPCCAVATAGRDAIAFACAVTAAAMTEIALRPYVQGANQVPLVVAGGMLLTAAALISTAIAPSPTRLTPTPVGAIITGLGFGLAVMPGASAAAMSFAILRWLGVAHVRAAEVALAITLFVLGLRVTRALASGGMGGACSFGEMALSVVAAFVGASLGARWWKALCERQQTPWLALWLVAARAGGAQLRPRAISTLVPGWCPLVVERWAQRRFVRRGEPASSRPPPAPPLYPRR